MTISKSLRTNNASIEYRVAGSSMTNSVCEQLATEGDVLLSDPLIERLNHLRFSWSERHAMARAGYQKTVLTLDALRRLATPTRVEEFVARCAQLAPIDDSTNPEEAFARFVLASKFDIWIDEEWRSKVLSGAIKIADVRDLLQSQSNILHDIYKGLKGGQRDHDLGWVLLELSRIYKFAGGKVTASSRMGGRGREQIGVFYTDSRFVRFCKIYCDQLDPKPRVEVGGVVRRSLSDLR